MLAANYATPAQALIKYGQLEGRDKASLTAYGLHTQVGVFFSFNLFIKELGGGGE